MAAALLHVTQQLTIDAPFCFIGSLSLDGHVLPSRHILPMVHYYPNRENTIFVISKENMEELSPIHGLSCIPISHLSDLMGIHKYAPQRIPKTTPEMAPSSQSYDDIMGHNSIKKACAYAIIGQHPLLLIGSPGIGKTMLIDHMKSLMPPLDHSLAVENTCIESLLLASPTTTYTPPVRAPHHSITYPGMLGGNNPPKPGEITRANYGILFLDELGEYQRAILDTLREPMETKSIMISRAGHSLCYPANFLLVCAMNPCYCGYYFDPHHICECAPNKIKTYWQRISKPLLDRISMCCILSKPHTPHESITHNQLKHMVEVGRRQSRQRNPNGVANHQLSHADCDKTIQISPNAQALLSLFFEQHHISIRGQTRLIKLSRTIADAHNCIRINRTHASEAIQLSQHHQLPL
jgi:magnesium chelatase family protein